MFDGLLYAAFYGFLLAFAIGPVFFTLIETSITKGFKAAVFFDLGAIFSDIIFIIIAFYSTSMILEKVKDDPGLLIFGGVVLIAFGAISYIRTAKSFIKIVREHYSVNTKKNHGGLFLKGFLLNFVNFGVLAAWIATIVIAQAITTQKNGVFLFLSTVLITLFLTDLLKIFLAKKLKNNLTPRFIIKTKKWVSALIIAFGVLLLLQGIFPDKLQKGMDRIPGTTEINKPSFLSNKDFQTIKEISYGSSPEQTFDIYSPINPLTAKTKVIVIIHGGSWVKGDKSNMESLLTRIQNNNPNYTIVNMNYVLANETAFAFPNQFMDIDLVLNELIYNQKAYKITPEFALIGRSAGGHLALIYDNLFDKDDRVKTVCSISGPTDFTHSFYKDDLNFDYLYNLLVDKKHYSYSLNIINEISPVHQITKKSSPTIIFHGTNDVKVSVENAELLEEKLNNSKVPNKLIVFEEGHSNWSSETMQVFDKEFKLFLENNF